MPESNKDHEIADRLNQVGTVPIEGAKITNEDLIKETKVWRVELDSTLQKLKSSGPSRERSLAITKIQEAIMWLGVDLKGLNDTNPYPNSYNPANAVVEPTADGLKM